MWGLTQTNWRGNIIENHILNDDLAMLNNGSPTLYTLINEDMYIPLFTTTCTVSS